MNTEQVGANPGQTAVPSVIEVNGKPVHFDAEGYLQDFGEWDPTVAKILAENDGLELGDDHWIAIDFLHRFYGKFHIAPAISTMARNLCKDQNHCRWTRSYLRILFPEGGAKSACRYAGLPKPVGDFCG